MSQRSKEARREQSKRSLGFTIVELVIIVAVIGVLAAMGAIGLGTWRTHIAETEVSSDLSGLKTAMEDARNRINGFPTYTAGTEFNGANSTKNIMVQSEYVRLIYVRGDATYYCVTAQSRAVSSVSMYLDTTGGNTVPQTGTC